MLEVIELTYLNSLFIIALPTFLAILHRLFLIARNLILAIYYFAKHLLSVIKPKNPTDRTKR